MNLQTLLHQLQFDPDSTRPKDWKVNWNDAPLAYKLYCDLPRITLHADIPLSLEKRNKETNPSLQRIGHFLWYSFGLTQLSQTIYQTKGKQLDHRVYRRFAPSGGALYPSECYLYLKIDDLDCGIYHYDIAHHALVLLRAGNFDSYIASSLGNRLDISSCFCTLFITSLFWKNFFKYHNFAYRLQGLDAGTAIGQSLEVAKRCSYETGVYYQFLDKAIYHLLGLSESEESINAIIPMSVNPAIEWEMQVCKEPILASQLCEEIEPIAYRSFNRSKKIVDSPIIQEVNKAAMFSSTSQFQLLESRKCKFSNGKSKQLPMMKPVTYDFSTICKNRYSPGEDFTLTKVSEEQFANLLQEATLSFSYRNDLDGAKMNTHPRVSIAACLYNVENIPDGAYTYQHSTHALQLQQLGDHRSHLQKRMTIHTVNLHQVPVCLHVTGNLSQMITSLGLRGYRIQQLEAGMLVQRLLLGATALGMNGHPLLSFDASSCDRLYQLQEETSLIQVPLGFCRPRAQLVGSLI